jgi:hypothetical protein
VSTHITDPAGKPSSNHLNRQISLYSLAAAVAGVSMLALAEPASGEVVVTKKTIPIPVGPESSPKPVYLSLANNGIHDLSFQLFQDSFGPGRTLMVYAVNKQNDGVIMGGGWDPYAQALGLNTKIGASASFFGYVGLVELSASSGANKYCKGYWGANLAHGDVGCGSTTNKYMGVRFLLNGKTHYGWVRLNVKTTSNPSGPELTASITEYAYESVANKTIKAGATTSTAEVPAENTANQAGPSLGMLAAGAESMPLWRREEASVLH